jgi:hypothetical protein
MYAIMSKHSADSSSTILETSVSKRDMQSELKVWQKDMASKGAAVSHLSDRNWVGVTYCGATIVRWIERI